ncbi:MAG: cyclase family protein [Thermoanaerobaculaceae bacterium]|jgi:kynurenine formamidase|nr:cyclase family protein [Thermoanaerobaculaceae bacterium]
MRVIDLSHPIHAGMPVYPGTPRPRVAPANTIAEHGFAERLLTLSSHTGTHMDAPAHLLGGAQTLDAFPPTRFVGPACVIDLTTPGLATDPLRDQGERLRGCSFALLRTGWSRFWGSPAYFQGFPTLTTDAATWLASLGLSAVGVDAISVDPTESPDLPVHRVLLGAGVLLIENLTNLELLPPAGFTLCSLPLPLADADGAPCRALAVLDGVISP